LAQPQAGWLAIKADFGQSRQIINATLIIIVLFPGCRPLKTRIFTAFSA
jgi:hypothetical protein